MYAHAHACLRNGPVFV